MNRETLKKLHRDTSKPNTSLKEFSDMLNYFCSKCQKKNLESKRT